MTDEFSEEPQDLQYWVKEAQVKNPHDRFFKLGMDNRQVVLELMADLLPQALRDFCVIEDYELIKQSFVTHNLAESVTDVLLKLPTVEGGTLYTYILWEHFRTVDALAAFRDWGYKHAIAEYHMRKSGTRDVPLIHTLVFYNGKELYTAPQKLTDLVRGPKELVASMFSGYQLVDLSHIPDEAFAHRIWSRLFRMALKHIDNPLVLEKLAEMADHLREVGATSAGIHLLGALIRYILSAGPGPRHEDVLERIKAILPGETGEVMMTYVEFLQEKGRNEGIELGRNEGIGIGFEKGQEQFLRHMLLMGHAPETIAQLTGGSLAQILKVQANLASD